MRTEKEIKEKLLTVIGNLNEMEDIEQTKYWLGVWKGLSFSLGLDIDDYFPFNDDTQDEIR